MNEMNKIIVRKFAVNQFITYLTSSTKARHPKILTELYTASRVSHKGKYFFDYLHAEQVEDEEKYA